MTDHFCPFPKLWYWDDLAIITAKEKPPTILTCFFLQFLFRQKIISCIGPIFPRQHKWFCHLMGLCSCLFLTGELQMRKWWALALQWAGRQVSHELLPGGKQAGGGGAQQGTDTAGGGVSLGFTFLLLKVVLHIKWTFLPSLTGFGFWFFCFHV